MIVTKEMISFVPRVSDRPSQCSMSASTAFLPPIPVTRPKQSFLATRTPANMCLPHLPDRSIAFVLSHFEAKAFLSLQTTHTHSTQVSRGQFSVDLGKRTLNSVLLHPTGISLNDPLTSARPLATWPQLNKMCKRRKTGAYEIFLDRNSQPLKIAGLSELTNMPASLLPIAPYKPPTLVLGGYGMHRIRDTDPAADTTSKLQALGHALRGRVLDVCTGLGYTAIQASRVESVNSVTTIEVDPFVVNIQTRNPWSQQLFNNPKIQRIVDDATNAVRSFPDSTFHAIVHDPPAQVLAGDLYGLPFYQQLSRVCVSGAKLFHYIGDPGSVESGRLYHGVIKRLEQAGFHTITKCPNAYGLMAIKA